MKITIEINDEELQEAVVAIIARESVHSYFKRDEAKGVEKAVKDVVYSQKDELIERCINRASAEITRKALPKLLERMADDV